MQRIVWLSLVSVFILAATGFAGEASKKVDASTSATKAESDLTGRKVLMIIAPKNFADPEFFEPKAVFEARGLEVTVASRNPGPCKGAGGAEVEATLALRDAGVDDFDLVVFVGGLGSGTYQTDAEALRIAREAVEKKKILGAICYAPTVLAKAGVLKDKKATAVDWQDTHKILAAAGAILVNKAVVKDGIIITANGPRAATPFARELVRTLAKSLAAAPAPAAP